MLSAILDNINKIQYEHIQILAPITIVDTDSYEQYQKEYWDFYLDQIQNAGRVVLSKIENKSPDEYKKIKEDIQALNPKAEVLSNHCTQMDGNWWESLLTKFFDKKMGLNQVYGNNPMDFQSVGVEGIQYNHIDELL